MAHEKRIVFVEEVEMFLCFFLGVNMFLCFSYAIDDEHILALYNSYGRV